jgi:hypothetical protein
MAAAMDVRLQAEWLDDPAAMMSSAPPAPNSHHTCILRALRRRAHLSRSPFHYAILRQAQLAFLENKELAGKGDGRRDERSSGRTISIANLESTLMGRSTLATTSPTTAGFMILGGCSVASFPPLENTARDGGKATQATRAAHLITSHSASPGRIDRLLL